MPPEISKIIIRFPADLLNIALAIAELLVADFTGRAPVISPVPYLPSRFNQMHDQEIAF
jgi:hypothetical protein